jgi:hypothetical protein
MCVATCVGAHGHKAGKRLIGLYLMLDEEVNPMGNYFNFSTRRVGGLRFVKIGRFTFMFCISREYKPL